MENAVLRRRMLENVPGASAVSPRPADLPASDSTAGGAQAAPPPAAGSTGQAAPPLVAERISPHRAVDPGCHGVVDPRLWRRECLHRLFEASADACAEHVAVAFGDDHVTYGELEARANQLARYLASRGVGRGHRVGILLNRSIEMYVSILAALKSGATYVPLDASYPADRVRYILGDCDVEVVVTTSEFVSRSRLPCRVVALDAEAGRIRRCATARLDARETQVDDTDTCYIIYTSGSTGRPKGAQIEHGSICHWVRAAQTIYRITPADRIYQGFSIAFDASLEELWMAWANGATLVPATPEMAQAGPELPSRLAAAGVTVLSCVPTLLSMFDQDIPSVRLLIMGGEACPQSLVDRWCRPGRRMLNTYGPTEATVTATWAECHPDEPVTIGQPLPNYSVYLLDPDLRPVPAGQPGEICIGGIGLARGYVGREDLTRERFVPNPFAEQTGGPPRLYRTGDLAQLTPSGDLQFLGRVDDQVKIRGFRVELAEIESVLMAAPGVQSAAVAVRELTPGIPSLVGYVVPTEGTQEPDWPAVEGLVRQHLPPYMLPARYESIDHLPTLSSGKVDRTRLPALRQPRLVSSRAHVAPRTELERTIAGVWASVFHCESVSATADFFHDLGGQSLYAALAASKLRALPALSDLSVSDIYRYPTVETLARAISERRPRRTRLSVVGAAQTVEPVSRWRHRLGGMLQAAGVYGIQLLLFAPLLLVALQQQAGALSVGALVAIAFASVVGYFPLMAIISILVKWAVIGRYRAGRYRLWGSYYLRCWLVQHVQMLTPLQWLAGTPLMPVYCRLMGARVGTNCHIDTIFIHAFDLLTIGDSTSINLDAQLAGYTVEDGMLVIGPIEVGRDCFVGAHAGICPGAKLADGAQLGEHSLLLPEETIPPGEYWAGSPARRQDHSSVAAAFGHSGGPTPRAPVQRTAIALGHVLGMALLPVVWLLAVLPGGVLIAALHSRIGYGGLVAAPLAAVLFIVCFCLETVLLKWVLLGKLSAGRYSLNSAFYVRKWFVDRLLQANSIAMNSLFSTLYALPYLRLLGAKMGENVEIERVAYVAPDLLTLHPESFIADAVYLGVPRVYQGEVLLGRVEVGRRTFIGNSALLPAGQVVADRCLVGVQSVPPPHTGAGTAWLGSPPLALPRRDVNRAFSETQTYRPTRRLRAARYSIEFVRVTLPTTLLILMTAGAFFITRDLASRVPTAAVVAVFPAVMVAAQVLTVLLAVMIKLAVIGRYQ
ncbi:MAG TPA: amino acid adenylation domain-containing protein, partial [Chloroflexota bacterium]|nr:amino acid adenylation domain-containing protein [Chloroflexota bacterium]